MGHLLAVVLRRCLALATVLLLGATFAWVVTTPAAAADDDVTVTGRGFGHGRGMGQWGAYGYAVDRGAGYQAILDHFYGGTALASDAGNPVIGVELLGLRGREALITGPGLAVNGVPLGRAAVRVRSVGSNTVEVLVADSCGGPWTSRNASMTTPVTVTGELALCEPGQIRAYRGSMVLLDGGGFLTTVNTLPVEDYLRGVVPSEVPASWGSAGGGRGMEALKAQAVAARSFALSSRWTPYATTCDTTACQVYRGSYTRPDGGAPVMLEDSRTDAAVSATAGQVRRRSGGTIARTEFHASSGGWTAGGEFPAVEDLGDATAANPNRSWSVVFTRPQLAQRLGTAEVTRIRVTQRNGLGADGGRVLQVVVDTTAGQRSFTGAQFREALGLKSDWFTLSTAAARSFVQALYVDILGRPADPGDIQHWTAVLEASNDDRFGVARGFAASAERFQQWINRAYNGALRRSPEPGGTSTWLNYLSRGGTLNGLNGGIYGSQEALLVLGGGDTSVWVDGVYRGLLGRGAGASERAFWAGQAARIGRAGVATAISTSAEARDRRLGEYYLTLLGRTMDAGGRNTFSPLLAGTGDVEVVASIAASIEYRLRAEARFA